MKRQLLGMHIGLVVVAVLVAAGCSGSVVPDGGSDAVMPYDATPTECGTQTCAPGQTCVHFVSVSGTATIPMMDGGGCPDGSVPTYMNFCSERYEGYRCSELPVMCGGVTCSLTDAAVGDGCSCGASGAMLLCSCRGV